MSKQPKVKSLYKALMVLKYFNDQDVELGVTEIAEKSGLLKSSVHNILQTFECCGYVVQNYKNDKYLIGSAAIELFGKFKAAHKIDYRVTQCLLELRDKCHSDVYLCMKKDNEILFICTEFYGANTNTTINKIGASLPIHCTAMGKILLGYESSKVREDYYRNADLKRYTPYTICDPKKLREEVQKAVYDGYAVSYQEYNEEHYCAAVPIVVGWEPIEYSLGISSETLFTDYKLKEYLTYLKDKSKIIASYLIEHKE